MSERKDTNGVIKKVTIVNFEDSQGIYVNGQLKGYTQDGNVDPYYVLLSVGIQASVIEFASEEVTELPNTLDDLVKILSDPYPESVSTKDPTP